VDRSGDERDHGPVDVDDVDGASHDAGAGPIGAVLLLGGAAVIIAGLTTLLPAWAIVVGIVMFALGCLAPLWTFWRRR
jgi:hypothetical protein